MWICVVFAYGPWGALCEAYILEIPNSGGKTAKFKLRCKSDLPEGILTRNGLSRPARQEGRERVFEGQACLPGMRVSVASSSQKASKQDIH